MKVDWQQLVKEDEGFDEYVREFSYFMTLAQGDKALQFIYANYQRGLSTLGLVKLMQTLERLQS